MKSVLCCIFLNRISILIKYQNNILKSIPGADPSDKTLFKILSYISSFLQLMDQKYSSIAKQKCILKSIYHCNYIFILSLGWRERNLLV